MLSLAAFIEKLDSSIHGVATEISGIIYKWQSL
jgi:hypothetical protein